MVKAPSEAVRPSVYVTTQEETNENSLSHYGETADIHEVRNFDEPREASSSSTNVVSMQAKSEEEPGEEEEDCEMGEEEAQEPIIRRAPKGPTKEEKERHEATHLPYRE